MRARAVIGANFGDEGKGLVTDYLCATQGAGMVVRFNGGAQAGHTVVTPDGRRHVFHHVGSGALCGVPTYLSRFFIMNPILFLEEMVEFDRLGIKPVVYAHPGALVTTFADMVLNQQTEDSRGAYRHGSCGVGIHETVERSRRADLRITMRDLWDGVNLRDRLLKISAPIAHRYDCLDPLIEIFEKDCEVFAAAVQPLDIISVKDPVFEGAQGLLLDQERMEFFPHVTHSKTGMHNVRVLLSDMFIDKVDVYYVSRTYLTRHGNGPLPGHRASMSFEDNTNVRHEYQGALRFAPLDDGLLARCSADNMQKPFRLVLTHCDQLDLAKADLFSYGPTRNNVSFPARSERASA